MYKGKRFLAIIPARSGSKGLIDKNIKILNNKHMIGYTIEAAKNSNLFDNIIVSTDSVEYAEISKKYGANVPFLRDGKLANDTASSADVIVDVIEKLKLQGEEYDYFVLLQPTSPLRNSGDIIKAIELLINTESDSVIGVSEAEHSLTLYNELPESLSMNNFIDNKDSNSRRQDYRKVYRINGAIYICEIELYLKNKNFYGEKSKAYIMDNINSIDIDNELDFKFAEFILKNKAD